jgi:hypothetical protein
VIALVASCQFVTLRNYKRSAIPRLKSSICKPFLYCENGKHLLFVPTSPARALRNGADDPWDAHVTARLVLSSEVLCLLLKIIPQYLDLCEKGDDYRYRLQR